MFTFIFTYALPFFPKEFEVDYRAIRTQVQKVLFNFNKAPIE